MKLSDINLREKEFHDKLQSKEDGRFENILYKAIYNLGDDYYNYLQKNCKDKDVLDYGCGVGNTAKKISKCGPKKITGIDISKISIEKAIKEAKLLNLNVEYKVDNCEETSLDSQSYDIIYGAGILHHLKLEKCIEEINRILKKDGKMVFMEPLGTNPLINIYRKMTPNSRSEDEHPLINSDFKFLNKKFNDVEIKYYGFLTLIFFPFYKFPEKSKIFSFLASFDQLLFKIKFMRLFAWSVLIVGKKI
jgi:ubiquinone/menaquinone biosynthesis C-methylase UbiE